MSVLEKIGNKFFIKHHVPDFFQWCSKRGYVTKDIEKFNPKEKLKIILRYKWFTEDDRSAQECEYTRQDVLLHLKNYSPTEEGDILWLKNAIYWEYKINKIKSHFGIISQNEMEEFEKEYAKK